MNAPNLIDPNLNEALEHKIFVQAWLHAKLNSIEAEMIETSKELDRLIERSMNLLKS
jgi:hypothetical protein